MVAFIGSNVKLARTVGQINFLLDCRTLNIVPTFILNQTSQLTDRKQRISTQVDKLRRTMINEEIKDAFSRKAFLQRSMTRSSRILETHTEEWDGSTGKGALFSQMKY